MATAAAAQTLPFRRIPIGSAYAANTVNATVFRLNSLTTFRGMQYTTYFAPDGNVVVAARPEDGDQWDIAPLPGVMGSLKDAHNGSVLGVSPDGHLHLAYNHHVHPMHYRRTEKPGDIRSFGPERPMTGRTETQVTYPQFVTAPDGSLLFFYRDGWSGAGRLCMNRYDTARGEWEVVGHAFIDGGDVCNPYWWRPVFGPDGALHLAWCWRKPGDARFNYDLCYARSHDTGRTWVRSDGTPQTLPVTPENAEVIDPVPMDFNLLNQCSSAVDSHGRPHFTHYHNDADGVPQYVHLWHNGERWERQFVSTRRREFSVAGAGTLKLPISRPEMAVLPNDDLWIVTRDDEAGADRIRLYRGRAADDYQEWTPFDVPLGVDLGEWEPTYDLARFARTGVLSLFVIPCRQADNEGVSDFGPQEAAVVEVALPQV
jgi:hypothetical protein